MIEILSATRCTACNLCVKACPENVFDAIAGSIPIIARKSDCQTCSLCELYCPADALYVSPLRDREDALDEADLIARGLMGSFAAAMGWRNAKPRATGEDKTFRMFEGRE